MLADPKGKLMSISRRTLLTAGAGTAALAIPGAAEASPARRTSTDASRARPVSAGFRLNAETLDGGEQVVSLTLGTRDLDLAPNGLTTSTFTVHATATSPIPIAPGDQIFSEYDLDRPVTRAHLDHHGDIVLDLSYAEGQLGGGTLGYIASKGRNVRLDLDYTVTQNTPLTTRHGRPMTITRFTQGRLANPEVDAFSYHQSGAGLKYRLFDPGEKNRRPLIVWLHGGGEGASLPDDYYDNETTLRANRGALGFATNTAQRIFGGAFVVAPQSTSYWIEDGDRFAPMIRGIVDEVSRRHRIDRDRVYVAGCSNGGYMSLKMTTVYPRLFAASIPICGVVEDLITDPELAAISTPTWLVASRDDDTVDPQANTIHAHDVIPRSRVTLYDHVIRDGYQFPGHWSWIYVARNEAHYWEWLARQR